MLEVGGETLVLTHDAMAEGVHWRTGTDPFDIAWKLVAVNLSDLAAKGAKPLGVLLGHSLGEGDARFLEGLKAILHEYGVPLLGGDTIKANGPRTLGLTAIGQATFTPVPSRSRAQAGDAIYVTGVLGRAMLGFEGDLDHADALNRPRPLLAEGTTLAPVANAMMDVSDGLLLDAWRMAEASGRCFEIESALVPVADASRREECMRWGDDYQLLFTAGETAEIPVPATRIGTVSPRTDAVLVVDGNAAEGPKGLGYTHH